MSRLEQALGYARLMEAEGFDRTLAAAPNAIVITEAALDAPGPRILHANAAFERLTGYDRDELVGATPRLLQGLRTDGRVLARMKRELAAEDGCFEGEVVNYRRGQGEYVIGWAVVPVRGAGGAVRCWLSLQHDISDDVRERRSARSRAAPAAHAQPPG